MNRIGFIATVVAVMATVSSASLVVYEGFGDAANEGQSLAGYSGTNAETGLTGQLGDFRRRRPEANGSLQS